MFGFDPEPEPDTFCLLIDFLVACDSSLVSCFCRIARLVDKWPHKLNFPSSAFSVRLKTVSDSTNVLDGVIYPRVRESHGSTLWGGCRTQHV